MDTASSAGNTQNEGLSLRRRIRRIMELTGEGLVDRSDSVRSAVLASLCGLNTFLYGPPGTAKSMICRRLNDIFAGNSRYFEHLMHRFSTPEELFGPISITKLKQDEYERQLSGYLADADFAFLDEIWKSSPAVLNTLLTLINEHTYHNGNRIMKAPLRSMAVASNEIPLNDDDLAALYDRFIVRLVIEPVRGADNFIKMVTTAPAVENDESAHAEKMKELAVTADEFEKWKKAVADTGLSDELLSAMASLREKIASDYAENVRLNREHADYDGFSDNEKTGTDASYVSDRRWVQSSVFMKAAAFFNEEEKAGIRHLILLENVLWHSPSERPYLRKLILNEIRQVMVARISNTDEGKILENSRVLEEILATCSNEQLFTDHNVGIRMTSDKGEPRVLFNMLKDFGFTYVKANDFWNPDSWYRKVSPDHFYTSETYKKCRNSVRGGKTSILLPEIGDVIRIILYRDLNGYFTKGDSDGTEVFTFSVPGHRGIDGQSLEEERHAAPSSLLPKFIQLRLKNRLDERFEMYARISEIQSHFGCLEMKIKTSIRIDFKDIFEPACFDAEKYASDVAAVRTVAPLRGGEPDSELNGRFMQMSGMDSYVLFMENGDRVLYQAQHGNSPAGRGEVITYERRFNGARYIWVEKNSYHRWFEHEISRLGIGSARHLNCTLTDKKELFAAGLHCVLNDGETPSADKLVMRLQTINHEKCLLELSPEDRLDIISVRIPYDEFRKDGEFDIFDHHGRVCGRAATREAPTGRSVKIRFTSGGEVNSVISGDIMKFLDEIIGSFRKVKQLIEENGRCIRVIRERLDAMRNSVNSDIFLSDDEKHALTAVIEEVYAPVTAEISRAGNYESRVNELVRKYSVSATGA